MRGLSATWICLALLGGASSPFLVSCSDAGKEAISPSGTLAMALAATSPSGAYYRLRSGTFSVTGPTSTVASTEDDLGAQSINLELEVGSYSVTLASGWFLERDNGGTFERVEATLLSPNAQDFEIVDRQTTHVRFRFKVAGEVIEMGGWLSIGIEVGCSLPAGPVFTELNRPGAAPLVPTAVSADGCSVIGSIPIGTSSYPDPWSPFPYPTHAGRWSDVEGVVDLSTPETVLSQATLINEDGSLMVLHGSSGAFVWTPEKGLRELSGCPGVSGFSVFAMSAAGDVLAGRCGDSAARWVDFQLVGEPLFGSDVPLTLAEDVSADGRKFACIDASGSAWLWRAPGGTPPLVAYDHSDLAISADGACVFASGAELLRWCYGEITPIPLSESFAFNAQMFLTNRNGTFVVMNLESGPWLWRDGDATLTPLLDVLTASGVDLRGWDTLTVDDMTPDGRVLVGIASNTADNTKAAFRLVMPAQWWAARP